MGAARAENAENAEWSSGVGLTTTCVELQLSDKHPIYHWFGPVTNQRTVRHRPDQPNSMHSNTAVYHSSGKLPGQTVLATTINLTEIGLFVRCRHPKDGCAPNDTPRKRQPRKQTRRFDPHPLIHQKTKRSVDRSSERQAQITSSLIIH